VTGSVRLSGAASAVLGDAAEIYVGLFRRRAPTGCPISGSLLGATRDFMLTGVPPGTYWLLATALPVHGDPCKQLLPDRGVVGACPTLVRIGSGDQPKHHDVSLDLADDWLVPVVVALPSLVRRFAQDWRRHA
jgi:hypothetical protein